MRVRVAEENEVRVGRGLRVSVEGEEIALFRVEGSIHAIANVCAHQHLSVLHRGVVSGCTVQCPMHGWTYDLGTGRSIGAEGSVRTFPVSVVNGAVFLEVTERA